MLWTDEAVKTLRRLAGEGLSATVIAEALGAESRNAVIGKANRIGVKLGGGRASVSGAPRAARRGWRNPPPPRLTRRRSGGRHGHSPTPWSGRCEE